MPLPPSIVNFHATVLDDTHPVTGEITKIVMANKMEAILTPVPPTNLTIRGSSPNGKALWWPAFQQRHKLTKTFWVQGHLLNDNVYGPGIPENLVPISNTLNSNMCALVEATVKKAVAAGKCVRYIVNAHWSQPPAMTRKNWGLIGEPDGKLFWGEQFAPTHLSWELYEVVLDAHNNWLSTPMKHGSAWYDDPSQWYNNWPG